MSPGWDIVRELAQVHRYGGLQVGCGGRTHYHERGELLNQARYSRDARVVSTQMFAMFLVQRWAPPLSHPTRCLKEEMVAAVPTASPPFSTMPANKGLGPAPRHLLAQVMAGVPILWERLMVTLLHVSTNTFVDKDFQLTRLPFSVETLSSASFLRSLRHMATASRHVDPTSQCGSRPPCCSPISSIWQ